MSDTWYPLDPPWHAKYGPHTVYMHLTVDGRVLYVGCTANLEQRTATHRANAPWWPEVAEVREIGTWTRKLALAVEWGLIDRFSPPHNFVGTSAWRRDMFDRHRRLAQRPVVEDSVVVDVRPYDRRAS